MERFGDVWDDCVDSLRGRFGHCVDSQGLCFVGGCSIVVVLGDKDYRE
jgi:hypothetical protein